MKDRYAAVRKQFGPSPDKELPILEYQTHQCRLFPHLAAGLVYYVLGETAFRDFMEFMRESDPEIKAAMRTGW